MNGTPNQIALNQLLAVKPLWSAVVQAKTFTAFPSKTLLHAWLI